MRKYSSLTHDAGCRAPGWTRSPSVQRALLLNAADVLASGHTIRTTRPSAAVVFIACPEDDAHAVLHFLQQCACLLAPCTLCGFDTLRASDRNARHNAACSDVPASAPDVAAVGIAASPSAAAAATASHVQPGSTQRYGAAAANAHTATTAAPAPWCSLLMDAGARPVPVVLQAITPAMLADVHVRSTRSAAFATYAKLQLATAPLQSAPDALPAAEQTSGVACAVSASAHRDPPAPIQAPAVAVTAALPAVRLADVTASLTVQLPQLRARARGEVALPAATTSAQALIDAAEQVASKAVTPKGGSPGEVVSPQRNRLSAHQQWQHNAAAWRGHHSCAGARK